MLAARDAGPFRVDVYSLQTVQEVGYIVGAAAGYLAARLMPALRRLLEVAERHTVVGERLEVPALAACGGG